MHFPFGPRKAPLRAGALINPLWEGRGSWALTQGFPMARFLYCPRSLLQTGAVGKLSGWRCPSTAPGLALLGLSWLALHQKNVVRGGRPSPKEEEKGWIRITKLVGDGGIPRLTHGFDPTAPSSPRFANGALGLPPQNLGWDWDHRGAGDRDRLEESEDGSVDSKLSEEVQGGTEGNSRNSSEMASPELPCQSVTSSGFWPWAGDHHHGDTGTVPAQGCTATNLPAAAAGGRDATPAAFGLLQPQQEQNPLLVWQVPPTEI